MQWQFAFKQARGSPSSIIVDFHSAVRLQVIGHLGIKKCHGIGMHQTKRPLGGLCISAISCGEISQTRRKRKCWCSSFCLPAWWQMQQCFNVFTGIYQVLFQALFHCCILLEIKLTTTTLRKFVSPYTDLGFIDKPSGKGTLENVDILRVSCVVDNCPCF